MHTQPDDPYHLVAIKIIRMRDIMVQSGMKEKELLKELNGLDPDDKRFIVKMLDSFEYRKHLCIVFEYLDLNLREVLKKYGKGIGLSLDGVKLYAKQLFVALAFLRKNRLIHADGKQFI
jgi:serine/threonine-protein kinase PRP4